MENKTIVAMPDDAVKRITKALDFPELLEFMDTGDFIVAGGYCRDKYDRRKPRDCDIYEMTGNSAMHKKELPGNVSWVPTQRITNGGRTARKVILQFDFSCNMACVYREAGQWKGLCHVWWVDDVKKHRIRVPILSSPGLGNDTIVRMGRLLAAGWTVDSTLCHTDIEDGHSS